MAVKSRLNSILSRLIPRRLWIQAAFLAVWLDPLGVRLHGMCSPVFHCYACPLATFACPIGVLATFTALHIFPFIAIGLLIAVGAMFGTLICGWMCPFGFLQDLGGKVPTPKFDPPGWMSYLRYVVLIGAVLVIPYFWGKQHPLFICSICPAGAVEGAVPNMARQAIAGESVVFPNSVKLTILVLFIVTIFFVRRPWCRILCPLGGIFSLFNRISAFFVGFDPDKCTHCEQCHKYCQLGIEPEKSPADRRCIRCLDCNKCGPGALSVQSIFWSNKSSGDSKEGRSNSA